MSTAFGGPAAHHGNKLMPLAELKEASGATGAERVRVERSRVEPHAVNDERSENGLERPSEPVVRGHRACAALEKWFGVELPAAPCEEDEAGGALHDAVDASCSLG